MAPVGIEQGELRGASEQGLLGVLAVDFDQQRSQLRQLRHAGQASIDPRLGAAVGTQYAAQVAGRAFVHLRIGQPCAGSRCFDQIELRGQFRAFGAVANHAGIGTLAADEAERIDQQRLAGPGLAGNDRHARTEIQRGGSDHGKVGDGEAGEHGA